MVFDLAPHGARGDRRDLRLDALQLGHFVDALDGDEGRVHVHRHQAEVGEPARNGDEGEVELRLGAVLGYAVRPLVLVQPEGIAADVLDASAARELGDFLEVVGFDFQAVDDEVAHERIA